LVLYLKGGEEYGDFEMMINKPEYKNSLFVFNDNVQKKGNGGTAVIRGNPKAVGIPTGYNSSSPDPGYRGFSSFKEGKENINKAFGDMEDKLGNNYYDKIYYSADAETGNLGIRIFKESIGVDVAPKITEKLRQISNEYFQLQISSNTG